MLATTFGVGIPRWLRPDAPWLASAAFLGSAAALVVYTVRRIGLKQAALKLWASLQAAQTQAQASAPPTVQLEAGELLEQAPSLPPLPVLVDEISRGVVDRIAAREAVHAPARPRSHRGS